MKRWKLVSGFAICLILWGSLALAVTAEELLRLKEAGVSEETIQLFLRLEIEKLRLQRLGAGRTIGLKTMEGPEGKRRVITYSVEDPEAYLEEQRIQEETEQRNREMLRNLVIDTRKAEREVFHGD